MSTLFTLAGCLTYTFAIITAVILGYKLIRAFKGSEETSMKAMLIYKLSADVILGTLVGVLFQNYARRIV